MTVKPKLLDQVRDKIWFKHYSIRTEQAYVDWIRRFILLHQKMKRHPVRFCRPAGRCTTWRRRWARWAGWWRGGDCGCDRARFRQ